MALPADTRLNERYTIRRALRDAGPFATTYLAYDEEEEQEVVVAEYFPPHLAERSEDERTVRPAGDEEAFRQGMKYFCKEAKQLRAVNHPNLASERESFEANGTSYRVSAYRAGASLATALEKNDGSVSERAALTVMKPVLGALHALHRQGLLHGGLTPEAIYLTESRKVLVRDVRGAQLQLARKTDALDAVVVAGMSPAEQYDKNGRQGPWTDVYAAAATFVRAVTGQPLPEAREPLSEETIAEQLEHADGLSEGIKEVLARALAPRPRGRMQSAQAFRELLDDPSQRPEVEEETPGEETPGEETPGEEASGVGALGAAGGEPAGLGGDMWGPASMAAAVAEAAQGDKEKRRRRKKAAGAKARQDRPPAEPGGDEANEQKPAASNRLLMGGGAVLVALLVAAGLFFTVLGGGESNAESSTGVRYRRLVAEGDSLYEKSDYQGAAVRYQEAQKLEPEEANAGTRVTERLLMIDRLQDAIGKENYQRAMSRGDSLAARARLQSEGDRPGPAARVLYEQANGAYLAALDSREKDSLALTRVQAVREALQADQSRAAKAIEETSVEEERKRLFARYRDQGDEALDDEDYETARRKFREALDYQPGNTSVEKRLKKLNSRISASERRRQYQRYHRRADSLYAAGHLDAARSEYQLALEVNPGDQASKQRISSIDQRKQQQRARQKQYQSYRSRADVRFEEGDMEKALASYQKALEYRPDDRYVKQHIVQAKKEIAAAKKKAKERSNRAPNGIYTVVDEAPAIVGGRSALYDHISYPKRARQRGVEGRVYLRATIGADGAVRKVEVLRGIGYGADEEAKQAVEQATFEPATVDGRPVAAYRTLMVAFKLNR